MKKPDIHCVTDQVTSIGEGPLWVAAEQALYWVDVGLEPKTLHRYAPATGSTTTWKMPQRASGLRERADGSLLIHFQRGLAVTDPTPDKLRMLPLWGIDFSIQRMNDSAVDPAGRLWIGSYERTLKRPLGELYRIDGSLIAATIDRGFEVSNGIAFSPDGRTLYHTDTHPDGRIYAWDFNPATGEAANRRVLIDFAGRRGHPDGCTIDAEGMLWVAEVGASQLIRIDPTGRVEREVPLPVSRPTSVAFGGPDLRTLYVTSMTFMLDEVALAREPYAGRLLAFEPGVQGLALPKLSF
ncbi:MAG: SMP-30/gluconolactonase/LRE family protein [Betaproteobacteria bacterium]